MTNTQEQLIAAKAELEKALGPTVKKLLEREIARLEKAVEDERERSLELPSGHTVAVGDVLWTGFLNESEPYVYGRRVLAIGGGERAKIAFATNKKGLPAFLPLYYYAKDGTQGEPKPENSYGFPTVAQAAEFVRSIAESRVKDAQAMLEHVQTWADELDESELTVMEPAKED